MNDHVTRPIDLDALFAALKRWAKPREMESAAVPDRPVSAADEVHLPEIAGIDLAGGLRRVAGNRSLYRNLLEQFARKQDDAAAQIALALHNGDRDLAGRIVHTVKGVAGNLGIGSIQLAAEKLERALRDKDKIAPVLLQEFESALRLMVQAIETGLATTSGHPSPESLQPRGGFGGNHADQNTPQRQRRRCS